MEASHVSSLLIKKEYCGITDMFWHNISQSRSPSIKWITKWKGTFDTAWNLSPTLNGTTLGALFFFFLIQLRWDEAIFVLSPCLIHIQTQRGILRMVMFGCFTLYHLREGSSNIKVPLHCSFFHLSSSPFEVGFNYVRSCQPQNAEKMQRSPQSNQCSTSVMGEWKMAFSQHLYATIASIVTPTTHSI